MSLEEQQLFLRLWERGDLRVFMREKNTSGGQRIVMASESTPGLGALMVKANGKMVKNKASRAVETFVENSGGAGKVVRWLEVVSDDPKMPASLQTALSLLRRYPSKRVGRVLAEAGASHGALVKWCSLGASLLGEAEANLVLRDAQPLAMRNLASLATAGMGCKGCLGAGTVPAPEVAPGVTKKCPVCDGKGVEPSDPEITLDAIKTLMAGTKMTGAGKGDVNVQVGVQVDGGGMTAAAHFERQMQVMERVMALPPGSAPEVIEAEVVSAKEKEEKK